MSDVIDAARLRPPSESYGRPLAISSAPRFAYPMPSCLYARVVAPIFSVGKSAKQIEMSIAVMTNSTDLTNSSESNEPSLRRNFSRFIDARLHDELSRCRYSLHGLDAVMRPLSGQVCQWLIVSSYCRPGSAHSHAACAILSNNSRAFTVSTTDPSRRARRSNGSSFSTARMNSSVTRTELFAFWYCTETMSAPPRSMSNPASRNARILCSSRAFVSTNSSTSGWSTSRMTIFAARRVAPPDLIVPALASAPRMKLTGPDAVPPEDSSSFDDRMRERFTPEPEPPWKIRPSSLYQSRIESIESSTARMKHALTCCGDAVPTLNHTGELKLNTWCNSIHVSSAPNTSASAGDAKYPCSSPALRYVFTTRSMSCFKLHSRSAVPSAPRKYFVVTMFAALMLHESGNSTPCCSKLIEPSRQFVMTTSRRSHVTSSYGCTPSVVHTRWTRMPAGALRLLPRADSPAEAPTLSVMPDPPRSLLFMSDPCSFRSRCLLLNVAVTSYTSCTSRPGDDGISRRCSHISRLCPRPFA